MRKFLYILIFSVFVVISVSRLSYSVSGNPTPSGTSATYTTKVVTDYISATSFRDLVQSADIVVVAKIVNRKEEGFNQARDPRDHSRPAADILSPAVAYELQVEQYLKGRGESTLYLLTAERTMFPQPNDKARAVVSHVTIPLHLNSRYVLFLRRVAMPYPDVPAKEWVVGVVEPYRFRLEGGMAWVESPWPPAEKYFPPMPEEALLERVRGLVGP